MDLCSVLKKIKYRNVNYVVFSLHKKFLKTNYCLPCCWANAPKVEDAPVLCCAILPKDGALAVADPPNMPPVDGAAAPTFPKVDPAPPPNVGPDPKVEVAPNPEELGEAAAPKAGGDPNAGGDPKAGGAPKPP